jgi:hypothetical protein
LLFAGLVVVLAVHAVVTVEMGSVLLHPTEFQLVKLLVTVLRTTGEKLLFAAVA